MNDKLQCLENKWTLFSKLLLNGWAWRYWEQEEAVYTTSKGTRWCLLRFASCVHQGNSQGPCGVGLWPLGRAWGGIRNLVRDHTPVMAGPPGTLGVGGAPAAPGFNLSRCFPWCSLLCRDSRDKAIMDKLASLPRGKSGSLGSERLMETCYQANYFPVLFLHFWGGEGGGSPSSVCLSPLSVLPQIKLFPVNRQVRVLRAL